MAKQQNISRILNTRIALVVICVNILVCILFYSFSVRLTESDFESQLQQQTDHLAGTLTQQLWLFDLNTANRLVELASGSQSLRGIRLRDHEGETLIEKGTITTDAPYYIFKYLTHDSGASVGSLELVYTDVGQKKQRNNILLVSLAVVFVTVLLSFLLISRVIQRFLIKPLQELQKYMGALAAGQFKVSSQSGKTEEIQAIINAFNAMSTALAQRAKEREEAEEQQQKLENELRQKYKMEAVGLMAGGIAHNFNNNLAIILGNLELIQLKAADNSYIADHLRDANIAVHRARDLTKQILTYSRQESHTIEPLKLSMVLEETVQLLRSTIPTTVDLDYSVPEDVLETTIEGDSTRIQEALINLCNNAVQAMDEKGRLSVGLTRTELAAEDIPIGSHQRPGSYVQLSVTDTGCGMSAEVIEKIFDPFFTTKDVDQGTGMGLSTVHGIIEQHKGFIKVLSNPGQGATFNLFFPEVSSAELQQPLSEDNDLPRGSERILFVDDDELLADLGNMLLSNQGYRVDAQSSSNAALEMFRKDPDYYDLLISDQTMPQMTGLELISEVRAIRPNMPVVLCTGYSSKTSPEELKHHNVNAFCLKPLKLADLAQTVRAVLDDRKKLGAS